MIIDTEKCTACEATKLAAGKWFEKKSIRITLSVIGFVVMAVLLRNLERTSSDYSSVEFFILKTPVLTVMVLSAAGLISNIGKFTVRKFVVSASASALILGIVYPICVFCSNVILSLLTISVSEAILFEVLRQIPSLITTLALALLPVLISSIKKCKIHV